MLKEDIYIVVMWPESQDFIGNKRCYLINDDSGLDLYGSSAYFVPVDEYEKVTGDKFIYLDM